MSELPDISKLDLEAKKVLVRADLDVGEEMGMGDDRKLLTNKKTIDHLVEKNAKVILIGHRGRPGGKVDGSLSLDEVSEKLSDLLQKKIIFVYDILGDETRDKIEKLEPGQILMLENLRFDPREENNDGVFARHLADLADQYINEAFSSSAKKHASIVSLPEEFKLKGNRNIALGSHFLAEIDNLSKIFDDSKKPIVSLISGVKEDKISYITRFTKFSEKVLVAGRLPDLIDVRGIGQPSIREDVRQEIVDLAKKGKVFVADLIQDKEDITIHSIEEFEKHIEKAGTIILGGPIGKFEDEGHRQGTKRVFETIVENKNAYKVGGGGDTMQAITMLGLEEKFDWISVGGGAMLDYLVDKTLPGIEVMK